jgi:hypothetical protein
MGSSATTSQTSGLSGAQPYLDQYANLVTNAVDRPPPQYMGPRVANLTPLQNQAIGGYSDILGQLPGMASPAIGMLNNTIAGNGGNPFTSQVVGAMQKPVIDAYNAATAGTTGRFNTPGNFGSDRMQMAQGRNDYNLSRGLADATGQLYSNAYEAERGRQMQAPGILGGLLGTGSQFLNNATTAGDLPRQVQQRSMDALYGDFQNVANWPTTQLQTAANAIGPLFGALPRTTTTTGPQGDPVQQGLGLLALGSMFFGGK